MKKLIRSLLTIFAVYSLITVILVVYENDNKVVELGKYSLYTESTNLNIVKGNTYNDIKIGDTITFYNVKENNKICTSVVTKRQLLDKGIYYGIEDMEEVLISENVVLGSSTTSIPHLGTILNIMTSRISIIILILVPLFLLCMRTFYNLLSIEDNKVPVKVNNRTKISRNKVRTKIKRA